MVLLRRKHSCGSGVLPLVAEPQRALGQPRPLCAFHPCLLCSARARLLELSKRLNAEGLRTLGVAVKNLKGKGAAQPAVAPTGGAADASPASPTTAEGDGWGASRLGLSAGDDGGSTAIVGTPRPKTPGQSPGRAAGQASNSQGVPFSKADEADMVFLGVLAFLDPLKEDAKDAVAQLHDKGGAWEGWTVAVRGRLFRR